MEYGPCQIEYLVAIVLVQATGIPLCVTSSRLTARIRTREAADTPILHKSLRAAGSVGNRRHMILNPAASRYPEPLWHCAVGVWAAFDPVPVVSHVPCFAERSGMQVSLICLVSFEIYPFPRGRKVEDVREINPGVNNACLIMYSEEPGSHSSRQCCLGCNIRERRSLT
jgi:hypothetical protein